MSRDPVPSSPPLCSRDPSSPAMQPHAVAIEAPGERRAAGAGLKTLLAGRRPPAAGPWPCSTRPRRAGACARPAAGPRRRASTPASSTALQRRRGAPESGKPRRGASMRYWLAAGRRRCRVPAPRCVGAGSSEALRCSCLRLVESRSIPIEIPQVEDP